MNKCIKGEIAKHSFTALILPFRWGLVGITVVYSKQNDAGGFCMKLISQRCDAMKALNVINLSICFWAVDLNECNKKVCAESCDCVALRWEW